MQTLLQSYYEAPVPFEEFSQPIRSPRELYAFVRKAAEKATRKRHLMLSPTHAFLFCPTLLGPIDSLETNPIPQLKLAQAEFLLERLADTLPPEARPLFAFGCRQQGGEKSLAAFRSQLLAGWRAALQPHPNRVDAFLYEAFPLFTPEEAGPILERIRQRLQIQTPIQCPQQEILLSRDLIRILKKSLIQDKGPFSSTDWGLELAATARIEGACISKPLLFGDTNWSSWSFGLVKNVATSEVELWRLSRTGLSGFPMTEWNPVFREGGRWSMIY